MRSRFWDPSPFEWSPNETAPRARKQKLVFDGGALKYLVSSSSIIFCDGKGG